MKKIILSVCAALMLFCGGASAKVSILKSSMASVTEGTVEYDAASGKFEWKQSWSNLVTMFDNLQGKASKYKHLKLKIANPSGEYRLIFYTDLADNKRVQKVMNASDTNVEIDLSTLDLEGKTLDDIARISIAGQGDKGSLTILPADVTLSTDDIETLTVTTTLDENSDVNAPFQWYKTTASGAEAITNEISNNFGKSEWNGALFGYSLDNKEINGYFNLNGYSALRVNVNEFDSSKKTQFRALADNNKTLTITMTGNETLGTFSLDRCTSLKDNWGDGGNQNFASIAFIGEYQAVNTESPFDIAASTGSKVSYDRTFTKDQPCTVCLPFALTAEELAKVGKAYTLSAVSGSKATFTPVEAIEAYKPYLLIPSADGKLLENISAIKNITAVPTEEPKISVSGSYSFVGTLQAKKSVKTPNTEVYGFSADGGKFVRVGENASIDAFRAYIAVPTTALSTAASRSIDIDFGGTTGINEIQNAQSSSAAATYDVAGKRVGKNYKGVVICNGKKMIQK